MADRTIDIDFNFETTGNASKGVQQLGRDLKAVEAQANATRDKMEKLAQVGSTLAMSGAAILAPFMMSMNKYISTVKDGEPVSRRILELNQKWEQSQVRIGRVTAEVMLPALEKALDVVDKIADFAERNPGFIQAAVGIGGTLVALGGMLTTAASIVKTIATVQGLAASLGAGGTAAGVGGAAAGGGLAASISAGFTAALPVLIPAVVSAVALYIGGNMGLWIGSALLGEKRTWNDILTTLNQLGFIIKWFFSDKLPGMFRDAFYNLGKFIVEGFTWAINGLKNLFQGGRAAGGYMGAGFYAVGERGREFVLNNSTTRAAEQLIGGRLTQSAVTSMMTNNINIGNRPIRQSRSEMRRNRRELVAAMFG